MKNIYLTILLSLILSSGYSQTKKILRSYNYFGISASGSLLSIEGTSIRNSSVLNINLYGTEVAGSVGYSKFWNNIGGSLDINGGFRKGVTSNFVVDHPRNHYGSFDSFPLLYGSHVGFDRFTTYFLGSELSFLYKFGRSHTAGFGYYVKHHFDNNRRTKNILPGHTLQFISLKYIRQIKDQVDFSLSLRRNIGSFFSSGAFTQNDYYELEGMNIIIEAGLRYNF